MRSKAAGRSHSPLSEKTIKSISMIGHIGPSAPLKSIKKRFLKALKLHTNAKFIKYDL